MHFTVHPLSVRIEGRFFGGFPAKEGINGNSAGQNQDVGIYGKKIEAIAPNEMRAGQTNQEEEG